MYSSECLAHREAEITIEECNDSHTVNFATENNTISVTLTTEQLLDLAESIEWYLLKKDEPANCMSCSNLEMEVTPTDRGNQPGYHCKKDNDPEDCKEWEE